MPHSRPLLTVAIPTYNCASFLPDAINSVLRQCVNDLEIVIFDNASTDNTEEAISSIRDPRIRYYRNAMNLGSRMNHNLCLDAARGMYFKFLGADDVFLGDILQKQLSVLDEHRGITLVSCNLFVTDMNLQGRKATFYFPGTCEGPRIINLCLSRLNNYIGGPSNFMFRLADAKGIAFDSDYRFVSDLKFGLQILERGNYANIGQPGYLYRRHPNSDSEINCPVEMREAEYVKLVEEFDWWNPLNCAKAMMRATVGEGKKAAARNWYKAISWRGVVRACAGVVSLLRIRAHIWLVKGERNLREDSGQRPRGRRIEGLDWAGILRERLNKLSRIFR